MVETGLVTIGTRGTVGSLLRMEMEYYSQLQSSSNRLRNKTMVDRNVETSSRRVFPEIICRFQRYQSWRKMKLVVPGICSIAERERDRRSEDEVPGFSYRILRDEFKNMHV